MTVGAVGVAEVHLPDGFDENAYDATLTDLIGQVGQLDDRAQRRTVQLLGDLRNQVAGIVDQVSDRTRPQYQRALTQLDETLRRFVDTYQVDVAGWQSEGFDLGAAIVEQPLVDAGVPVPAGAISPETLTIAQGFSADLIQGLSDDLRRRVNSELVQVATGVKTPFEAMSAIGRNLHDPNHFRTVKSRAQAIVTTEVGRVVSVAGHANLTRISEHVDGLRKRWQHSGVGEPRVDHLEAAARYAPDGPVGPIPVDEPYVVGGHRALYPRAGNLPAAQSVFCRCQSVPWINIPHDDADDPPPSGDSWQAFGFKTPRAADRRRLVDEALKQVLASEMGGKFRQALAELDKVRFQMLSPNRNLKTLGRVSFRAADRSNRTLMMEMGRHVDDAEWAAWQNAGSDHMRQLWAERDRLPLERRATFDVAARMKAWQKANPKPGRTLATVDDFAQTLTHELTHAWDVDVGRVVARQLRVDGVLDDVRRRRASGDTVFWYAATNEHEALAELTTFYLRGTVHEVDTARRIDANTWRQAYPDLAEWVRVNVIER